MANLPTNKPIRLVFIFTLGILFGIAFIRFKMIWVERATTPE